MSFRISSLNNLPSIARTFNGSSISEPRPEIEVPKHWVSDWFELLLRKVAQNKLGPTVTTRWLFIAGNCLYNSYQFITEGKESLDNEYWRSSQKGDISSNISYVESWVELSCQYFFPKMIKDYMKVSLADSEVNSLVSSHSSLSNVNINSLNLLKTLIDSLLGLMISSIALLRCMTT